MRSRYLAAIGFATLLAACAHSGTKEEPEAFWVSTRGADQAQFIDDTADCLSRPASEFVPCMNGKGWDQQASVGAARPAMMQHR